MHYEGNIIRPPSEANSILVQVTVGCSHNKCTFCGTYLGERFRIKPDSIIMEGARMTDEWPFIEQRLPDRNVVFVQADPGRELIVVEPADDDFDDLERLGRPLAARIEPPRAVEHIAEKVEPLRKLLEARKELSNLMTYMDGKSGAEELMTKAIQDPALLKALASAPKPAEPETPSETEE